jgi:glycosyltransferase involved in cell wall biosynthesis
MAADALCLPSLREGFGTVILEAAAVGVPAIGSRIYGIVDAIEDGVTGLMHDPADVAGILSAMETMVRDSRRRREMGAAAKHRAIKLFRADMLSAELLLFYKSLLADAIHGSQRA